jgi:CPA2 family monovalent cation:H+ antiporter-2
MAPWIVGLGLSQIGEFSFVLARVGRVGELISKSTYDLALTCTVLTMCLSPLVSRLAFPLGRMWQRWRHPSPARLPVELPQESLEGHAIIAGCGRSGIAVARVLQKADVPLIVVEINHAIFSEVTAGGLPAVWGDITRTEILEAVQIRTARLMILAMPEPTSVLLATERATELNPSIAIIARASRPHQLAELRRKKVDAIIQPEFEGGIEMVRQALEHYPCAPSTAARLLSEVRNEYYADP